MHKHNGEERRRGSSDGHGGSGMGDEVGKEEERDDEKPHACHGRGDKGYAYYSGRRVIRNAPGD